MAPLSVAAVRRSLPLIRRELGRADQKRIASMERLLPADGEARLRMDALLDTLFPGQPVEAAQAALRQFRGRLRDMAAECGIRLTLEADTQKRSTPQQRWCWFEGDDAATAAAGARSDTETEGAVRVPQDAVEVTDKRIVRYFVSYAHNPADRRPMADLVTRLGHCLGASREYSFRRWHDFDIVVGREWHAQIQQAIQECDFGLLLLSPAFLSSSYIREHELPALLGRAVPVMLRRIALDGTMDLRGLEPLQIFKDRHDRGFAATTTDKEDFVHGLFQKILQHVAAPPPPPRPAAKSRLSRAADDMLGAPDDLHFVPTRGVQVGQDKLDEPAAVSAADRVDALDYLRKWATSPAREHYCAVLGELGIGKTTTVQAFTQALLAARATDASVPLPIYLDLRLLGDAARADMLLPDMLRTILARTWHGGSSAPALAVEEVMRLVQQGGAIAIFDGLDEVLVHLTASAGQAFIRQLFRILPPTLWRRDCAAATAPGRVLLTCRSHFFRTLRDQKTLLAGEDREGFKPTDFCALQLLPFTDDQIRSYLIHTLPGEDVDQVLATIGAVHNLPEMAERPLTLAMIAAHLPTIERWKREGRRVTGVDLYRHMLLSWLERDTGKHHIRPDDKQRIMEHVAAAMWRAGQRTWPVARLERAFDDFLAATPEVDRLYPLPERELLKEDLRTATFLVREGEDQFRFAHSSLLEFFLASHLLRALRNGDVAGWDTGEPSVETLDFLGQMLLGEEDPAALSTLLGTLRTIRGAYVPRASELALRYLLLAQQRAYPGIPLAGFRLDGADLRGWTIAGPASGPRLSLSGAVFTGARLRNATLRRLDLQGADFTRAGLPRAELNECRAGGTSFDDADLTGTLFRACDLADATWAGASLYRTQLLACSKDGVPQTRDGVLRAPTGPAAVQGLGPLALTSLTAHSGLVTALAFAPDGRRLASAGSDGTVRLWDAATGEALATLEGHRDGVNACAFAPDGRHLASAGGDGTVRLWDAATGEALATLEGHRDGVNACAFAPDGRHLASAGDDGTVRLWDAATGEALATLEGHRDGVNACAFAPDGRHLASAGRDGTVRLWDAATGEALATLEGHRGWVRACAFAPDGRHLASAGRDGTVRLWDAATGEALATLEGHRGWVRACAFAPDGRHLASAGFDGTVRLWDAATGEALATLEGHRGGVNACAFAPDGRRLASAGDDGTVRLWDAATGEALATLEGHGGGVMACAFAPDGRHLASAGHDGTVRLWDAATGEALATLEGHRDWGRACAFAPDGRRLASAGDDGTVRLWDAATGEAVATLEGHRGGVNACAFAPDGRRLASAGDDGTVRLWDAATGEALATLEGHGGWVMACAFAPDGRHLASAGHDGTVRLWDAATGEALATLEGHRDWVRACAFAPDGRHLASAGRDGTVRLWDAATGEALATLEGHRGGVMACAFAPDGRRLASAGGDGTVRLWDAATGEALATLEGHRRWVMACAFAPDGRRLASAGHDGTVRLWDAATAQALLSIHLLPDRASAVFDRANDRLLRTAGEAWRWLGWTGLDAGGILTRLPAETFGPLPGPDGNPPMPATRAAT